MIPINTRYKELSILKSHACVTDTKTELRQASDTQNFKYYSTIQAHVQQQQNQQHQL